MAHPHFPHLFSPLTIGSLTVKNRIVFPPIGTRLLEDASKGWFRRMADYYEEHALGGRSLLLDESSGLQSQNRYSFSTGTPLIATV